MSDVAFGLVQQFFGTASGDQDASDANFGGGTPKAAMLFVTYATALNTRVNHFTFSCGAAESATQGDLWCFYSDSAHGQANTDTYRKAMDTQSAYIGTPTSGIRDGWTDINSTTPFAANKVTWDINNTYNSDYANITWLLGGADLNVKVGTLDVSNDTAGTETRVNVGFSMTNSALLLFGLDDNFSTDTNSTITMRAAMGMGSYDGTTFRQASIMVSEADIFTDGVPVAYLNDDRIFQRCNTDTGAAEYALEWTDADADEFAVTVRNDTAPSNAKLGYVALGLPSDWNAHVSVQDTPTTTGNKAFTPTGASGWTPQILIQIMSLMEAVDTAKTDDEAGGIGVRIVIGTASDDEYCWSGNIEDLAATTNTEVGTHDKGFLPNHDGSTAAGSHLDVSLVSFDSAGWTDNYAAVFTAAAKKQICLIMGEDDAAPTGHNPQFLPLQGVA